MTVTEDAPAAAPAAAEPPAPTPDQSGLAAILGSGDHKVVARLWLVAAVVQLLLAGAAAMAVALEGLDTSSATDVLSAQRLVPVDTFRFLGTGFLFVLPLTIAVATAIVPLQVGASTLAFPRAAAAAAWTNLMAGGLVVGSYAIDGGPGGTDVDGVRLFVVGFALVLLAQLVAWICIATTVIALRAPGVSLSRTPPFAWSTLVAAGVWLLTLPVLLALLVISYLDVRYGGLFGGDASTIWSRLSWVFSTPAVYAFAIPALGFVASVLPVFAQTRHHQHRVALGLIGAFGALSLGAWTVPGLGDDPTPWLYEGPWVAVSIGIVLPLLGLFGLWALTARTGQLKLGSPLLFAVAAGLMILVGVLAGAVQAIEPLETLVDGSGAPLFGTSWSTAVEGYLSMGTAIALAGAVVFWAPKLLGAAFPEAGARVVALLLLAGTVLAFFPELIAGLLGQPAGAGAVSADNVSTIEALNTATAVGVGILGLGGLVFILLLLKTAFSSELPGDDPWAGHTLEWATSSPPPVGNFASLPVVTSEAPLYDARHRNQEADA